MLEAKKEKFYSSRELINKIKSEGIKISERTFYRLIERKEVVPDHVLSNGKARRYYFSEENAKRIVEKLKNENLLGKLEENFEIKDRSIEDIVREEQEAISKAYKAFCEKIISIKGREKIEELKALYRKTQETKDVDEETKLMDEIWKEVPPEINKIEDFDVRVEAKRFFLRMLTE